jgi:SAM-dependent methyltransferase
MIGNLRKIYRSVVPLSVRESTCALRIKQYIYEKLLWHDAIYDAEYYEKVIEGQAVTSAITIAESISVDLCPATLVDVGCGTGALLEALRSKGCRVFGLEYSEAALRFCHKRSLDVRKFDLERALFTDGIVFDVAVSMEVAEHLPEKSADRYVALLARLSDVIVFTAAPPGQGGTDHINEKVPSYWIQKFREKGFTLDEPLAQHWRRIWESRGNVTACYYRNLMIFKRREGAGRTS